MEVQRTRDAGKRVTWPIYLAHLWKRHRCPVYLVVIAPDPGVAGWCAQPIPLGHPGFVLRPLVVGPHQIPRVTSQEQAQSNLPLAVLSAVAHGAADPELARLVLVALLSEDADARYLWIDLVLDALPAAAAERIVEDLMSQTHEFKSAALRGLLDRGRRQGREVGKAEAILQFLAARDIEVPDALAERIRSCHDVDTLDRWIARAATASSADEVVDE